jgi:hypothetical protein
MREQGMEEGEVVGEGGEGGDVKRSMIQKRSRVLRVKNI